MVLNWCGGTLTLKDRLFFSISWEVGGLYQPVPLKPQILKGFFTSQSKLDEQNFPVDQPPTESNFEVLVTFV